VHIPNGRGEPNLLVGRLLVDHIRTMLAQIKGHDPALWNRGQSANRGAKHTRYEKDAHCTRPQARNPHANLKYLAACQATPPWQRLQVYHTQIVGGSCWSGHGEWHFITIITNVQLKKTERRQTSVPLEEPE
jgi:hypothetical protein